MNTENTTTENTTSAGAWWRPGNLWYCFNHVCAMLPRDFALLLGRIAALTPFWRSAQQSIDGGGFLGINWAFYSVDQSTIFLFQHEFNVPILPPVFAAHTATAAEFFFSIMLFLGLGTRLAALGLLGMTAVIQIFVLPWSSWSVHILWAALLVYLVKDGGGRIALDHWLGRFCKAG